VLGVAAFFYLTDWPREARWLPEEERAWITEELEGEKKAKKAIRDYSIWEAFRDRRVMMLISTWLLSLTAMLAATYWLPTFIKRLSHLPDTRVALLVALPGICGIVGMVVNGWHSDKTGERRWHGVLPLVGAGTCFLLLVPASEHFAVAMILFSLGCALFYSFQPVLWAMPTMLLCESAAAAAFGLINSIGQMGGLAGPYVVSYLNEKTGGLTAAFVFIGICFLLSASVLSFLRIRSSVRTQSRLG
jgi:predicted MFS family arabinose efflux permease